MDIVEMWRQLSNSDPRETATLIQRKSLAFVVHRC